jgi:hypothetical protein
MAGGAVTRILWVWRSSSAMQEVPSVQQLSLPLGRIANHLGESWTVPSSASQQPLVFDADGSLRPSLLGYTHTEDASRIQAWVNEGSGLRL